LQLSPLDPGVVNPQFDEIAVTPGIGDLHEDDHRLMLRGTLSDVLGTINAPGGVADSVECQGSE